MSKRLQGILVGLVAGIVVASGIAYAVTVIPPNSGDVYYGCFSSVGKLKASTVQVNNPPTTCPTTTDVVRSWNSVGPVGPAGPATPASAPAATVIDLSTLPEHQDVVLAPGATHVYPTFSTIACRGVSVAYENVTSIGGETSVESGNSESSMYGKGTANPIRNGVSGFGVSSVSLIPMEGFGAVSRFTAQNPLPSSSTITIGKAYAYCYPY